MKADIPTLPCKIMLVGDHPDAEESNAGRVFVGARGHMLDTLLYQAGLAPRNASGVDRSSLYITNVFMQRPPQNDFSRFFIKRKEARDAGMEDSFPAFSTYGILRASLLPEIERLRQEIKSAQPNIIVALGSLALWALCSVDKIANYRGTILPCTLVPDRKVIATYHPGAILRDYSSRPTVIADLVKVKHECEFRDIRRKTRSIWIAESLNDIITFEKVHMEGSTTLAIDVETEAAQITHICIAPNERAVLVIPFWDKRKPSWHAFPEEVEILIKQWLARIMWGNTSKVFHNAIYDLTYLAEEGIVVRGRIEDTMLKHHSHLIELPKSLGYLGSLYTSEGAWKNMRIKPKKDITKKDE